MTKRTYRISSLLLMAWTFGCNQPVEVGEPPPPEVNRVSGLLMVSSVAEGSEGRGIVLVPQNGAGELQGTVPTGTCKKGRHEFTLEDHTGVIPDGAESVGAQITLSAQGATIPMARMTAPGAPDTYYLYQSNQSLAGDTVHVQWDGDANRGISRGFDADAIDLPAAPDVGSSVVAVPHQPLQLSWTGAAADMVTLAFVPAANRTDLDVVTCAFPDQGSATIPATTVDQIETGYDRVQFSRVKIKQSLWFEEKNVHLGTGGHPVYGIAGIGVRLVSVPLKVQRKRAFVTSRDFTGDLRTQGGGATGLAGGDNLCHQAAQAAQLGGTWKALLSSSTTDAAQRFADVGPWYLLDGTTRVFENRAALAGQPLAPINRTETGTLAGQFVWTGTGTNGGRDPNTCLDWTTESFAEHGRGGDSTALYSWQGNGFYPCSNPWRLYCFEQ